MSDQQLIKELKRRNAILEEMNTRQHLNDDDEIEAKIVSWLLYPFILVVVMIWHGGEWVVEKVMDKYKKNR